MTLEGDGGAASGGEGAGAGVGATESSASSETTGGSEGVQTGGGEGEAPPAYEPNFKYTGDNAEREIPEWARPLVRSKELETQFKDLFAKSDGLETVKAKSERVQTENQAMREQWAPIIQNTQRLSGLLQAKDYDSFFRSLQIPPQDILQYAHRILSLADKPEALAAHNQAVELRQQNQSYEQQIADLTRMQQQQAVQYLTNEIDTTLSRNDISGAVQTFDARVGTPGAFRTEVIRRGKAYDEAGQQVTVGQVVTELLQMTGLAAGMQPAATVLETPQAASGQATGAEMLAAQRQKPTLPNISGRGGSPAKKAPRSVEEIRARYREVRLQEERQA